jgi:hypothetical protein
MKKTLMMFLAVFAVLAIVGCKQQPATEEPVACTMDAKACPDGSFVGREGPNCEFAACPGPAQNTDTFVVDRQVKGENEDVCSRIKFACEEGYEYYAENGTCGCAQYGYPVTFKGTDIACTREYNPVCVWHNESVKCFAYPCAVTVSNPCEAQTIESAAYYTMGACPATGSTPGSGKIGENEFITYTYQPMQCQQAPWEKWYEEGNIKFAKAPTDAELIIPFYAEKDVEVSDVQRVESDMFVCSACDVCPTTYSFTLVARAGDALALKNDGWTHSEAPVKRKYASHDPNQCAAMTFICEEGRVPFFDKTGCGCELDE